MWMLPCKSNIISSWNVWKHFKSKYTLTQSKIMLFPPPTTLPETWQMNAKTDQHMTWTQHEFPYTFIDFILIMLISRYWAMVGVKEGVCVYILAFQRQEEELQEKQEQHGVA